MPRIRIPRVAVSRELASALVKNAVSTGGHGAFEIDGRGLVVNNDSFAYQLAEDLKKEDKSTVSMLGGSPKWFSDFKKAAEYFDLNLISQ